MSGSVSDVAALAIDLSDSEWSDLLQQLPLFPPAAQPPRTLQPFLSPLLRHKLGFLSLGRGSGWAGALTWLPPDQSYKVNDRLKSTWLADGLQERFRGYRRFDDELILANIALEIPNLELWFSWIGQEDGETGTGWKLHDIRLAEVDRELEWFESISEANAHFHDRNSISLRNSAETAQEQDSDDDDTYWNQYDQTTGHPLDETADTPNAVPILRDGTTPSAYFDQYDNIETAITDGHFMQHAEPQINFQAQASSGNVVQDDRNKELELGLEEYIANTLQNLKQLAIRSGMSKTKFAAIVQQGL